ncbi:hypothetical protein [Actomonas aquatica]|uniref:XRE family transcriptional regulator n=1 Tax=Actomonas aquatica TaxID=2866162 RepID=A0ABZ1C4A3_9BACT|nr:hypothetical protein [Opitutus sp. WL0086]WRQ86078.1 hypothetical protein K1X11_014785 [Opitutus sp. WL0086]
MGDNIDSVGQGGGMVYRDSRAWLMDLVADLVWLSMEAAARAARRRMAKPPRRGVGITLRPGDETGLWNALVERVQPHLRRPGAQAILARELELPRQRVHDYFIRRNRMPDAERTLRILTWVIKQETPEAFAEQLAQSGARRSGSSTASATPDTGSSA